MKRRLPLVAAIVAIASSSLLLTGCAQTSEIDNFMVSIQADAAGTPIAHHDITYSMERPAQRSTVYAGSSAYEYLTAAVQKKSGVTCKEEKSELVPTTGDAVQKTVMACKTKSMKISITKLYEGQHQLSKKKADHDGAVITISNKKVGAGN
jgi:outer membrane murein-binding lipoprotein Lpp